MGRELAIPSRASRSWKSRKAFTEKPHDRSITSSARRVLPVARPPCSAVSACLAIARTSATSRIRLGAGRSIGSHTQRCEMRGESRHPRANSHAAASKYQGPIPRDRSTFLGWAASQTLALSGSGLARCDFQPLGRSKRSSNPPSASIDRVRAVNTALVHILGLAWRSACPDHLNNCRLARLALGHSSPLGLGMLCCGIRLACRTARVAARTGLRLLTVGLLLRLRRP